MASLWQTVARSHTNFGQYVDYFLNRSSVGEREHDTAAIGDEYLECDVLQDVASGEYGAYLVEMPFAVQVICIRQELRNRHD